MSPCYLRGLEDRPTVGARPANARAGRQILFAVSGLVAIVSGSPLALLFALLPP